MKTQWSCNPNPTSPHLSNVCIKERRGLYSTNEMCIHKCVDRHMILVKKLLNSIDNMKIPKKIDNVKFLNQESKKYHTSLTLTPNPNPNPNQIRNRGAQCIACYGSVVSSCTCEQVSMWQTKTKSRPMSCCMMTYGLGGCTALIIVSATHITLAHYPEKWKIRELINNTSNSDFVMVITPGDYIQDLNGKWKLQSYEDWDNHVLVRAYSENRSGKFGEGMVAIKEIDGKVSITNEYGVFKEWTA